MRSRVISFSSFISKINCISQAIYDDRLTVYAAQTSFYICISVIPFALLVTSLAKTLSPQLVDEAIRILRNSLPNGAEELFDKVLGDAIERPALPILSLSAVTTLWSAAKGFTAAVRGLSEVFGTRARGEYFVNVFSGLAFTVLFTAAISVTLLLLVVFESIGTAADKFLPAFLRSGYKGLIVFSVLILFFSSLYYFVAKGGLFARRSHKGNPKVSVRFRSQFVGASVASAGWIIYSFFYSLYFKYYSGTSYVYGGLAAAVLLMLWIYFCAVIFLFGAEINKVLYFTENHGRFSAK